MADVGIAVTRGFTYGGRIGRVNRIEVRRGQYSRQDLSLDESHLTVRIEGLEGEVSWEAGEVCFPVSLAISIAKAILSVADYAERQEIALPN